MTITPGASLDSAIAGITRGVDNARKVATEINKETAAKTAQTGKNTANDSKNSPSDGPVGGNLNVTA